jgi:hypothetical protein
MPFTYSVIKQPTGTFSLVAPVSYSSISTGNVDTPQDDELGEARHDHSGYK